MIRNHFDVSYLLSYLKGNDISADLRERLGAPSNVRGVDLWLGLGEFNISSSKHPPVVSLPCLFTVSITSTGRPILGIRFVDPNGNLSSKSWMEPFPKPLQRMPLDHPHRPTLLAVVDEEVESTLEWAFEILDAPLPSGVSSIVSIF